MWQRNVIRKIQNNGKETEVGELDCKTGFGEILSWISSLENWEDNITRWCIEPLPETKIEKEESGAFLFPAAQKIKNDKGGEDKKINWMWERFGWVHQKDEAADSSVHLCSFSPFTSMTLFPQHLVTENKSTVWQQFLTQPPKQKLQSPSIKLSLSVKYPFWVSFKSRVLH